jgi:uncharacterized protein (TIGR00297 family)
VFFRLTDWIALIGAFVGIGGLVGVGEVLRRWGWASATTRRLVHVGVGLFVVATPLFFSSPGPVYALAGAFILINGGAKWRHWWPGVHAARPDSWGTVVMPLVLIPALAATWTVNAGRLFILQLAFLVLALADPMAAWIGQKRGRRTLIGTATVAGSAVFFSVAVFVAGGMLLGRAGWTIGRSAVGAFLVAGVATAVEAISQRGWDNFFVVVGVVLVLVPLADAPTAIVPLGLGLAVGAGFGAAAYASRTLDVEGAVGGGLFAASLVGLGGWAWALPGLVFFVLSSALSLFGEKTSLTDSEPGSVEGRTLRQVLANGGVAWGLLGVFVVAPVDAEGLRAACYMGFLGALAAAAADTWATEIGVRTTGRPWSLRTFSTVDAGVSGAVSIGGTVGALLGAASVAGAAILSGNLLGLANGTVATVVIAAGWAGMMVDSVAGATVEVQYRHPETGRLVEEAPTPTSEPVRGWAMIDNEAVNLLGTTVGALTAILLVG